LQKKGLNEVTSSKLIVALDQVTDPQNIGAIMRSSKVFGASSIITTKKHSPGETGSLAKAASGALEYINIVEVTNLASTLTSLSKKGFIIIGLDELGESKMNSIKLDDDQPRVLVMGSEGKGLRRLTKTKCDIMAVIENKTNDEFSTLNVSASAAISLYQLSISN
jgi:23S rRNA (guanosine2251-2'-O)-methyltransferase